MPTAEQRKELRFWLQDQDPTSYYFKDPELDYLLQDAKIRDSEYRHPTASDWVESYDLKLAASFGWVQRATRQGGEVSEIKMGDVVIKFTPEYCYRQAASMVPSESLHGGRRDEGKTDPVGYRVPKET